MENTLALKTEHLNNFYVGTSYLITKSYEFFSYLYSLIPETPTDEARVDKGLDNLYAVRVEVTNREQTLRNKDHRGKGKHSQSLIAKESVTVQCPNSCNNQHRKLKGELRDRILLRRVILKQIYNSYIVDISYNQLIEKLIDLEESFVTDD